MDRLHTHTLHCDKHSHIVPHVQCTLHHSYIHVMQHRPTAVTWFYRGFNSSVDVQAVSIFSQHVVKKTLFIPFKAVLHDSYWPWWRHHRCDQMIKVSRLGILWINEGFSMWFIPHWSKEGFVVIFILRPRSLAAASELQLNICSSGWLQLTGVTILSIYRFNIAFYTLAWHSGPISCPGWPIWASTAVL